MKNTLKHLLASTVLLITVACSSGTNDAPVPGDCDFVGPLEPGTEVSDCD